MDAVVQRVCTSWSKRSRGEPGASRRNAAPVAFPLPLRELPFVHEVLMDERDDFQPHVTIRDGLPDASPQAGVLLREERRLLRVHVAVTPFGMPRRWRRPPAVRLASGDWLRWQINYRFAGSCDGDWSYRLDTFSIAHGAASADLFLGTPAHHISELAALR